MTHDWEFDDSPEAACFTTTFVLQGSPILRVFHDYDGDWQFHGHADQPADDSTVQVVALGQVVQLDASVGILHDLPCGWAGERDSPDCEWRRFKDTPFPSFPENGYYLEDGQCERMWVEITGFDDDGYFVGTIENDPQHDATKYGESLSFHPLHVAEIYVDE